MRSALEVVIAREVDYVGLEPLEAGRFKGYRKKWEGSSKRRIKWRRRERYDRWGQERRGAFKKGAGKERQCLRRS